MAFCKSVKDNKRILYDLFITIENIVKGTTSVTRNECDNIITYRVDPFRNQPTVYILYDKSCQSKATNNSKLDFNRKEVGHGEERSCSSLNITVPIQETGQTHLDFSGSDLLKSCIVNFGDAANTTNTPNEIRETDAIAVDDASILVNNTENANVGNKSQHERIHTGEKPFACDFCNKKFTRASHKIRHERRHTGETPFACDFCHKKFILASDKEQHERLHMGEKPFACDFCHKKFTRASHKIRHERRHMAETPFACDVCHKKFILASDKEQYERLHTGEKPFACEFCHKKFTRASHKKQHERLHTGEKPYHCQYCEKTFTQLPHKIRHERNHMGEKPYSCAHCDKKFAMGSDKKKHETHVHKN